MMHTDRGPTLSSLVGGVLATVAFHVAIGWMIYQWRENAVAEAAEAEPEWMAFESVELLQLGEVMPNPYALPTIVNHPPEERPEDVVDPTPEQPVASTPVPEDEPPVQHEDREEEPDQRHDDRTNPDRPTNNEPSLGSSEGVEGGTSLTSTAIANLFGRVQTQLQSKLRLPASLSAEQIADLVAVINVTTNEEGRVLDYRWLDRSGNTQYDNAVEDALDVFRLGSERLRLPFDHEEAMALVLREGFTWRVRPTR